ncbi:hypothetical protein [Rubeoparvulum massiliense]|uniref:hypothetical protein n=1 Tax=Rubeoparvulum massiliense TaxID=1631346 RepID=UPI00065E4B15|nr:hypothetical protein [Rubeoparvulum massiliense]
MSDQQWKGSSLWGWQMALKQIGMEANLVDQSTPIIHGTLPNGRSIQHIQGMGWHEGLTGMGSHPVLVHYDGPEVWQSTVTQRYNPYAPLIVPVHKDEEVELLLKKHAQFTRACTVFQWEVVPSLLPHFERIYVIPVPYSGEPSHLNEMNSPPQIMILSHPGCEEFSAFAGDVCTRIRNEGMAIEWQLVDTRDEAACMEAVKRGDIIIDQLSYGWYTPWAVMAMGMGKVVFSYLREDLQLRHHLAGATLYSTSMATLESRLRQFLNHPDQLAINREAGYSFFEQHHHPVLFAHWLMYIYEAETRIAHQELANHSPFIMHAWGTQARFYRFNQAKRLIDSHSAPMGELFSGQLQPDTIVLTSPPATPPLAIEAPVAPPILEQPMHTPSRVILRRWKPRGKKAASKGITYTFLCKDLPKRGKILKAAFRAVAKGHHGNISILIKHGNKRAIPLGRSLIKQQGKGKQKRQYVRVQCTNWVRSLKGKHRGKVHLYIPVKVRANPYFTLYVKLPI